MPSVPLGEHSKEYWEKMDSLFYRTIDHAETAFKITLYINIIVVIIGIVIVAYSIIYGWTNSLDLYSTLFGTLGVATFVSTFYLSPQREIQKTVGDLTQIQMFYRTYYIQAENISDYAANHPEMSLEEMEKLNKHLEEITLQTAQKIQDLVGAREQ